MKLPPYSRYKSSGVEWLGDVPEHWEKYRIKHTTYVKGRIGWQGLRFDEFIDEGPYLVTGTDFVDGRINWNTCYHITPERFQEDLHIQLREDDLLITKDGTIGKVAIVKEMPGPTSLNSGVFVTRPTRSVYSTGYMYWLLNSNVFSAFIDSQKSGVTIAHLYQNVFVEFCYPTPPLTEQQAIASFLDRETGRVNRLMAKKRKLIELLQEKRNAVISSAVTRGLPSAVARAAGLKENPPLKHSGIEWLGEIPEHWEAAQLRRKAQILDCKHRTVPFVDEGIPLASIREVHGFEVDLTNANQTSEDEYLALIEGDRRPRVGDIVYSRNATVGDAALVTTSERFCMGQDVCLIRAPKHHPKYLLYLFRSFPLMEQVESLMIGSTFRRINVGQIHAFWICIPPLAEQVAIAAFLDKEMARIERLLQRVSEAIERLQEYRTALITAAVTGKIDVRKAAA